MALIITIIYVRPLLEAATDVVRGYVVVHKITWNACHKQKERVGLKGSLWILPHLYYVLANRCCCRFIGLLGFLLPNLNCYSLEETACVMFVAPEILTHLPLLLYWPRNKKSTEGQCCDIRKNQNLALPWDCCLFFFLYSCTVSVYRRLRIKPWQGPNRGGD